MPKIEFTVRTVSPMFLNGATSGTPDILRAPSVRGQLRYWFRAIKGASIRDTRRLFDEEARVFGTTEQGSPVTIRMWAQKAPTPQKLPMLPHRLIPGIGDKGNRSDAEAYAENTAFTIQLVTRPGMQFERDLLKALTTWQLIGGLGKRSRRTFGALQHTKWESSQDAIFPKACSWWQCNLRNYSVEQYADVLRNHFDWVFKDTAYTDHNRFPALILLTSRIVISGETYKTAREANQEVFRLIRSKHHKAAGRTYYEWKNQGPFGGVGRPLGRLASPLHIQVRQLNDGYHLVLTAIANALQENHRAVLRQFMKDAVDEFKGISVWGKL